MQSQGMKSTLHNVHHHKDCSGGSHKDKEGDKASNYTATAHKGYKDLVEEHFSQLRVS